MRGVVVGEHGYQLGNRGGEVAFVEGLLGRVGKLLADDPGQQDGPVALDLLDGRLGA